MFETTSETIARVLARDAQERAGEGGLRQYVRAVHRAEPTGFVYPVSRQPQLVHFVDFYYTDGYVETFPAPSSRSASRLRG